MPTDEATAQIGTIGDRYRATHRAFATESDRSTIEYALRQRPDDDVWSVIEYLAHLRDVIDFYGDRFERVLTLDRPPLPVSVRFAELAEMKAYRTEDVEAVLASIERQGNAVARLLRDIPADAWTRVGIGSEGDERTLIALARRLAHEAHHHLIDVEQVAERVGL